MGETTIPWTERTWNPIRARDRQTGKVGWHCEHRSPACMHCYAERQNRRLGTGARYLPSLREAGRIEVFLNWRDLVDPLMWRTGGMVFPCSMTDIAGEFVPFEWLEAMFGVMSMTPQHRYQVLTKRPDRLLEWFRQERHRAAQVECVATLYADFPDTAERWPFDAERAVTVGTGGWPLPHVWVGTSIEDRQRWRERLPILREIPAAVHWLSVEPMMEDLGEVDLSGIGWVVCGGLSGAGDFDVDAARRLRDQCREQGVAFFLKQLGTRLGGPGDFKGEDPENWPPDLRVREYPTPDRRSPFAPLAALESQP